MPLYTEVRDVKSRYQSMILSKPHVVGVGVGYKIKAGKRKEELCISVLVRKKLPRVALPLDAPVPGELDGVTTDVVEAGILQAHQTRTDRWRPIPAGVSIGHHKITAGTIGCIVHDRTSHAPLILSNNHVLANGNQAQKGDAILQPGSVDGGKAPEDQVARLERFIPIAYRVEPATCQLASAFVTLTNRLARFLGSTHRLQTVKGDEQAINQVDAALAQPVEGVELLYEILDIGQLSGTAPAALGMAVRKSGRTTGVTEGEITVLDATIDVYYGESQARFEGQIVSTPMSEPGDSGAILVKADSLQAVGLLFAGSDKVTLYNPIETVFDRLQVSL